MLRAGLGGARCSGSAACAGARREAVAAPPPLRWLLSASHDEQRGHREKLCHGCGLLLLLGVEAGLRGRSVLSLPPLDACVPPCQYSTGGHPYIAQYIAEILALGGPEADRRRGGWMSEWVEASRGGQRSISSGLTPRSSFPMALYILLDDVGRQGGY